MKAMNDEIIRPESAPKGSPHSSGNFGSFLAASGATMLAATKLGAAMAASVWAFSKLFGFPDTVLYVLLAIGIIPVLWATVWTAGRAWHVEKRLSQGLDIDQPVFSVLHYLRRN
jgi:hypothetical protein